MYWNVYDCNYLDVMVYLWREWQILQTLPSCAMKSHKGPECNIFHCLGSYFMLENGLYRTILQRQSKGLGWQKFVFFRLQ